MKTPIGFIFQGGRRRVITIAATAGNVILNLSPGAGKRWIVQWGTVTLVCDATVVNRYPNLKLTDGTNITLPLGSKNTAVTNGQTKTVGWSTRESEGAEDAIKTLDCEFMVPELCVLEGADELRISIGNGVVGDSYSGFAVVLEVDV